MTILPQSAPTRARHRAEPARPVPIVPGPWVVVAAVLAVALGLLVAFPPWVALAAAPAVAIAYAIGLGFAEHRGRRATYPRQSTERKGLLMGLFSTKTRRRTSSTGKAPAKTRRFVIEYVAGVPLAEAGRPFRTEVQGTARDLSFVRADLRAHGYIVVKVTEKKARR